MADTLHPQTPALKRGEKSDPESSRETQRLQKARVILACMGIEPTITHSYMDGEAKIEDTISENGVVKPDWAIKGMRHQCTNRCEVVWPEWVTTEIFDGAMRLADLVVTERGSYMRREIGRGGR